MTERGIVDVQAALLYEAQQQTKELVSIRAAVQLLAGLLLLAMALGALVFIFA
jgi:hypothetical protein